MKTVKVMIVALATILILAACSSGEKSSNANKPTSPAANQNKEKEPAKPNDGASSSFPVTIKHELGSVTLDKAPERVVYLFQGMNDTGAALGVKPVGAVESVSEKPWFAYLGDMSGVESVGDEGQPNLEKLVELKPDLIIGTKVRHEAIYKQLNAIAPTIVTADLAAWKDNLQIAGQALGKQAEADKLIADWDARLAEFREKMGDKLATTEVSVIRIQRDNSVKVYLAGFPGLFMRDVGFAVPKAQQVEFTGSGLDILSKEYIPQFDADYIFDITTELPGQENVPQLYEEWVSHPLWKEMNAVKNGNYIRVDPIVWNFGAGPLAARQMLEDLFKEFKL
ncbi:putative siderophore-binding lipoprotein YfiY [Paenibacillus plantiphilus]|uniref:Siderophore-binding lipoprotein YfiY n=1 Tax=Paenibacillus plantiphilus TaxID=2905650 RepID=A0ABM9BMS5_9BACL|nr:iron-siderophore ABC transporter substrate-binding protein [Paenibacillus plantiphilus]CAH1189924.1 putative siderophore-binding lipoprotein YfiY [Paenibacillus plantiphilus]